MKNFSKFLLEVYDLANKEKNFGEYEKFQFLFNDLAEKVDRLYEENSIPAQERGLWEHHSYKYGLLSHCYSIVNACLNVLINEFEYYSQYSNDTNNFNSKNIGKKLKSVVVGFNNIFLETIIFYGALLHDVAKIFGEKGYDHSDKSYELILNNLDKIYPECKTFFYNDDLKKIGDYIIRFKDHERDNAQKIKEKYFSNVKTFKEGIQKVAEYLNIGELTDNDILFLYIAIPVASMVKWHHMNFSHPNEFAQRGADLILFNEYLFPFVLASIGADFLSIAFSFEKIKP